MQDVLAGHPDIVGDLVDFVALLGAGKDSRAAQTMDGRVVGVVRFDIPLVLLDLDSDPLLPAAAEGAAFLRVGEPSAIACTEAVSRVLRCLRRIIAEGVAFSCC